MQLCAKHKDGYINYIFLKKNSVNLACIECMTELIAAGEKSESFLLISKILKIPEVLISKINIDPQFTIFFSKILEASSDNLNAEKKKWVKAFEDIEVALKQFIYDVIAFFDSINDNLNQYRYKLKELIQFHQFDEYLKINLNLQTFDQVSSIILTRRLLETTIQIEQKIQDYINSTQQMCNDQNKQSIEKLIKDYKNTVNNIQFPNSIEIFNQFQKQFETFQISIHEQFKLANPTNNQYSSLLSNTNFQSILTKITQKKFNSISNLIYQGSIDGLNSTKLWNKIQNKSNLLMIMKTKDNQCIIGGYTPCQWLRTNIQQMMSDQQGTSFLFIQNVLQQLIYYPIKSEWRHQAIIINEDSGISFGKPDLFISKDFKQGQLNLGNNYFRDPKENSITQMIGPKLNEIIEFEVFEISK